MIFKAIIHKVSQVFKSHDQSKGDADACIQNENVAPSLSNEANYDLSDPNAFELLTDDTKNAEDSELAQKLDEVHKAMLSVEISKQKGVEIRGNEAYLPGRIPLMTCSLLETLLCTLGFTAGLIHFATMSPNYILPLLVVSCVAFLQIIIYHSSYRAQRIVTTVFQTLSTLVFMALVTWAFLDQYLYPPSWVTRRGLLAVALVCFALIPVFMVLHLVFLGRGHRVIKIKKK